MRNCRKVVENMFSIAFLWNATIHLKIFFGIFLETQSNTSKKKKNRKNFPSNQTQP